jgi:hypothetical protein
MTSTEVIFVIAVAIVLAIAAWVYYRQQCRKALRARFGPEYSRAVEKFGNEKRAEKDLSARERRLEKLHIHPLAPEDYQRFLHQWQTVQHGFVDDPAASIERADALIAEVMRARGYPVTDFEHSAEDISVDHPEVVQKFRAAHDIAERHQRGEAATEDLRKGLVYYRDLFDDLLESHPAGERIHRR